MILSSSSPPAQKNGYADLVLVDGERVVLVNHKCLGVTRDEAVAASAGHAGQVGTYAEAIARATGKRCAGRFVHLVAQGGWWQSPITRTSRARSRLYFSP
jgi:hypothetical protein